MITCRQLIAVMQQLAPEELAEDFDNVGLLVGRKDKNIQKVLLALDIDEAVAKEAAQWGADIILSHHPVIFHPEKRVTDETPLGRTLLTLIENQIAVYSAHTNLDSAAGGLNDFMVQKLGLVSNMVLDCKAESRTVGLGRICTVEGLKLVELAKRIQEQYNLPGIRFTGEGSKEIRKIGICSGGGGSMIEDCIAQAVDVYIAGDIKYNQARDLMDHGIALIELGHYTSEFDCCNLFEAYLNRQFGSSIETAISKTNRDIFEYLV